MAIDVNEAHTNLDTMLRDNDLSEGAVEDILSTVSDLINAALEGAAPCAVLGTHIFSGDGPNSACWKCGEPEH